MPRLLLWPLALLAASIVSTAAASDQPDPCAAEGACRYVKSVTVPWEGRMQTITVGYPMPWVIQNNLVLFPGDVAVISLPIDQDGQLPITLVATGEAANNRALRVGELRVDFSINPAADGMVLHAESAHPHWLHYMAVMTLPNGTGAKTSVCPIVAGKQAFEMWPHGIVQLALTNFTPEKEGETLNCR